MPNLVCMGSTLHCSFGAEPAPLAVLPELRVLSETAVATVLDSKPLLNILPFGLCSSPANPAVIAATAAAAGVPTPAPCIPSTNTPWIPGAHNVLIGGIPALNSLSLLFCDWGGEIAIAETTTPQVVVP